MTPQEQQMLSDFLSRLAAVHDVAKDPQVDAQIHQALAAQPDANYLLVQRALLLERALENAHAQIAELQATAARNEPRDPGGASFLNAGLAPGFGRAPTAPGLGNAAPEQPSYTPPVAMQPTAQPSSWRDRWFGGAPASSAPVAPTAQASAPVSGGSSFLGTAAASAAGVAGGMFLFNGLEHMLGGQRGGSSFFGGNNTPVAQERVTENVTENVTQNFYDGRGGASSSNDALNFDNAASSANSNIWDDMTDGLNDGLLDDDLTT